MQLRGGTKDKSGQVVRVSRVTVHAGLVGCQGLVVAEGRTGTEGECGREHRVGSGLGVCPGVPSINLQVWAWPQLVCCALTSLAGAQGKVR
jgi:hypothetical protein